MTHTTLLVLPVVLASFTTSFCLQPQKNQKVESQSLWVAVSTVVATLQMMSAPVELSELRSLLQKVTHYILLIILLHGVTT